MPKVTKKRFLKEFIRNLPYPFSQINTFLCPQDIAVALMSAIVHLSGIILKYRSSYNGIKKLYPHLYLFISGPSGSGKSVAERVNRQFRDLHKQVKEESEKEREKFESEGREGQAPPYKSILIPANITEAALIEEMEDNESHGGVLFAPEADGLISSMKKDYGSGISYLLRAGWSHEIINKKTKTDQKRTFIECPKLAVLLTGTNDQIDTLLKMEGENGLANRFIYLNLDMIKKKMSSEFSSVQNMALSHIKNVAEDTYNKLKDREEDIIFQLTKEQRVIFDETIEKFNKKATHINSDYNVYVKRIFV